MRPFQLYVFVNFTSLPCTDAPLLAKHQTVLSIRKSRKSRHTHFLPVYTHQPDILPILFPTHSSLSSLAFLSIAAIFRCEYHVYIIHCKTSYSYQTAPKSFPRRFFVIAVSFPVSGAEFSIYKKAPEKSRAFNSRFQL